MGDSKNLPVEGKATISTLYSFSTNADVNCEFDNAPPVLLFLPPFCRFITTFISSATMDMCLSISSRSYQVSSFPWGLFGTIREDYSFSFGSFPFRAVTTLCALLVIVFNLLWVLPTHVPRLCTRFQLPLTWHIGCNPKSSGWVPILKVGNFHGGTLVS